jgi:hypothetical protein
MTVTTVFAGTADGYVESVSTVYSTARAGAGLSVQTSLTQSLQGQQFFSPNYKVWQYFIAFDVSAISASDTIDAVTLALNNDGDNSTTDFTVLALAKTWLPTLTTADFVAGASLSGLTELATLNTSPSVALGYVDFVETGTNLRAAVDAAAGVGSVEILIASSRHRDNNTPTGNEYILWATADASGTTKDPKLTITHSAAAGGAPSKHLMTLGVG